MNENVQNSIGIVETKTIQVTGNGEAFHLACGKSLSVIDVAYETYGKLNAAGTNTILICHALSGDAHVAGKRSIGDEKRGWWDNMVGPGKAIDTNKYFVICSNILGGCSGTTGPGSINPATNRPYGLDFPIITIADMVGVQKILLDKLKIKKLASVIGGSMGGMQALQWAIDYPDFVDSAVVVASSTYLSAQSIAFDAVGRNAILADPDFTNGSYTDKKGPNKGLATARMIGHITYLSEHGMRDKFGRELRNTGNYKYDFSSEFAVETYLAYQGQSFVERFDANSYLYITKAMDYFDLKRDYGSLEKAFANTRSRFLVLSFSSDWLFTPEQSKAIVRALAANKKDVSCCDIDSPYGHDAFLLEPTTLGAFIKGFLETKGPMVKAEERPTDSGKKHLSNKLEGAKRVRVDYEIIESLIEAESTVLDVGCGQGELLSRLIADKNIKAEGIEIQQELVLECVKKGISVIQHDIELGLQGYVDKNFDVVILSQTVQTVKDPVRVFKELLRVGKKVIVSFPNFAHWNCRLQLFFKGKAPVSKQLPFSWHDSPNMHFLSLKDFDEFCEKLDVKVEKKIPLVKTSLSPVKFVPNIFAEQAIYVTSKK